MRRILFVLLLMLSAFALAAPWQRRADGQFIVETASLADLEGVGEVFAILQDAARDLRQDWGWTLPASLTVRVYPTLTAYTGATHQPWYVAAMADRNAEILHLQRLRVLIERDSLEITLRHELFHLAQPSQWPRWRAEGNAMRFAGETSDAKPYSGVSEVELDARLAAADSRESLARAAATAWLWTLQPDPGSKFPSSAPKRSSSP